jgi:hypothetical protein
VTTCTLTDSAPVARQAVRTFFWRKFASPLGAFYLLSFPLIIGAIWFVWSHEGPDWFVGMFGFVLFMNLLFQLLGYFLVPRIFARRALDPSARIAEVETSANGIRISRGGNTLMMPWSRFINIWLYDNFVVLVRKPPLSLAQLVVLPADGMSPQMRLDLIAASQGEASRIT